jgi:hypothetical protein
VNLVVPAMSPSSLLPPVLLWIPARRRHGRPGDPFASLASGEKSALERLFASDEIDRPTTTKPTGDGRFVLIQA